MAFDGRKFERWMQQNPETLKKIISKSDGDANIVERLLSNKTNDVSHKEIRELMIKAYESRYPNKSIEQIKKEIEDKSRQESRRASYVNHMDDMNRKHRRHHRQQHPGFH